MVQLVNAIKNGGMISAPALKLQQHGLNAPAANSREVENCARFCEPAKLHWSQLCCLADNAGLLGTPALLIARLT